MREYIQKAREKLNVFMSGRYGYDELEKALLVVWTVMLTISWLASSLDAGFWIEISLTVLCFAVAAITIFRFLSRKIFKRSAENDKFLKLKSGWSEFFRLQKARWNDRKTHVYRKCPECRQAIRLPKVKGRHTSRCPQCGAKFKVRISGGRKK